MSAEMIENWTKYCTTGYAVAKEFSDIYTKAFAKFGEHQEEALKGLFEANLAQSKLLGEAKGYKDLLSGQVKLLAEQNEKLISVARETSGLLEETRGEVSAWLEKSTSVLMEPIQKFAPLKKAA
jgi:hypothetical protein